MEACFEAFSYGIGFAFLVAFSIWGIVSVVRFIFGVMKSA